MALQPQQMNMPPQQMDPDMDMQATGNPLSAMPAEAREAMMRPSEEIKAVLLARLANMEPQELQMLDSAITPEVAIILSRFLPELQQIVDMIAGQNGGQPMEAMQDGDPSMGALSGLQNGCTKKRILSWGKLTARS